MKWCDHTKATSIGTMEQLQPDPLVDMTSKDLDELHKELTLYVDRLGTLVLPTWANPCLILEKLGELEESVDYHDLLGAWFSAHARLNNVVVMVTSPEICLVSSRCFIVLDLTR